MFSMSRHEQTLLLYRIRSTEFNLVPWYFQNPLVSAVRHNAEWVEQTPQCFGRDQLSKYDDCSTLIFQIEDTMHDYLLIEFRTELRFKSRM